MIKLMIIWGSTRTGRQGGTVVEWVKKNIEADPRFAVDFVDLKQLNLPFFDEPSSPFDLESLEAYTNPAGKAWAERIQATEAFIIITPEYNRGLPGVLKNALDWVGKPWIDKPVGFVSYGGLSGGMLATAQLRLVAVELGLIQAASGIHFPYFKKAFNANGQPNELEKYTGQIQKMRDRLVLLHEKFTAKPAST